MVGMAIPYAKSSVVVVGPDGLTMDESLIRFAARQNKSIAIVPASMFPRATLTRLQTNYAVRRRIVDSQNVFDPAALRLLDEEPDRYSGRVPKWLTDLAGRGAY